MPDEIPISFRSVVQSLGNFWDYGTFELSGSTIWASTPLGSHDGAETQVVEARVAETRHVVQLFRRLDN